MQFREICSPQHSIIINTFWVDPNSDLLQNVPVKPKNRGPFTQTTFDAISIFLQLLLRVSLLGDESVLSGIVTDFRFGYHSLKTFTANQLFSVGNHRELDVASQQKTQAQKRRLMELL